MKLVRKCASWVDSFVEATSFTHSPVLYRKWAAISTIAAVTEQRTWVATARGIHPNLYIILVGHPGVGKTRIIREARAYMLKMPDFHMAPTSMTAASLVDALAASKRFIPRLPDAPLEYNTLTIAADELGSFVHKYDNEMIANLSAFYDPDPYGHHRRGKELKIKIERPQLNLLCGSTPSNLMAFMPEGAWEQGFTSRIIMVFSDERIIGDDFDGTTSDLNPDLVDDLKQIGSLIGEARATEDYRKLISLWREAGESLDHAPAPNHPKLLHYNTRRRTHLYKLSLIACLDRGNTLLLTREDFNRAMSWLTEAETYMPDIFKAGSTGADAKAMDEIWHMVMIAGKVHEHQIVNYARERVPAHSVMRVIEVMERSNMIRAVALDKKTGMRIFVAIKPGEAGLDQSPHE